MLALGAAWWAGRKIQQQIQQVDAFNQDQARRRLNGARVRLPAALSGLLKFSHETATSVGSAIERINVRPDNGHGLVILRADPKLDEFPYPSADLQALTEFVECLNDRDEEKHVAELIASLQVYAARYETQRRSESLSSESLHDLLLDSGKVKFLAEAIFNYARFADNASFAKVGTVTTEEAWRGIQTATLGLVFDRPVIDGFMQNIGQKVQRYIEHDISLWLEKFEA